MFSLNKKYFLLASFCFFVLFQQWNRKNCRPIGIRTQIAIIEGNPRLPFDTHKSPNFLVFVKYNLPSRSSNKQVNHHLHHQHCHSVFDLIEVVDSTQVENRFFNALQEGELPREVKIGWVDLFLEPDEIVHLGVVADLDGQLVHRHFELLHLNRGNKKACYNRF